MRVFGICGLVPGLLFALVLPAAAQAPEPIGPFAVDLRFATPGFKDDLDLAAALDVASANLPGRGLGFAAGAHLYPVRLGGVTVGFGGELLVSRGSHTQAPLEAGGVAGPTVRTRLTAVSPQLSLNFGAREGWSYISGGIGLAGFTTERQDQPAADPDSRPKVINYGAGARWFVRRHVAFAFDLRFHSIDAQPAAPGRPAQRRMTLMVISAGASFK